MVVVRELQGIMIRNRHIQDTRIRVQDIGGGLQDITMYIQDIGGVVQDTSVLFQDIVLNGSRYYDMPFKIVVNRHHYISVAALLP